MKRQKFDRINASFMKVTQVGPDPKERGGIASVMSALSLYFSQHRIPTDTISTIIEGNTLTKLVLFTSAWLSLTKTCVFRSTSIVHIHMSQKGSCLRKSLLALTCLTLKMPYIIHLHGSNFDEFYEYSLNIFTKRIVRFVFFKARKIIALSNSWRNWLERSMSLTNVVAIYNGVPAAAITRTTPPHPTVLFLGRLSERKGTDTLIAAIRELSKHMPQIRLELAGDGDIDRFRNMAKDLPNVHFLGWITQDERNMVLSRASVFCLPSWQEGLPMSILEAMSAGLPVVSTPIGGIPEAVDNGITGILVPPGDAEKLATALIQLLSDDALATKMGSLGKQRFERYFSLHSMGESCVELYKHCIERRQSS